MVQEKSILRSIRRVIHSVDMYSHRLYSEAGVTVPQLSCLIEVAAAGPMTLKALAKGVNLSSSTLVGIVDRLQKKDLLHRERSGVDRREVLISVTEEGRILALSSPSPLHDRLAAGLQRLPPEERAAIAMALERIVDLMEIGQVDAAPILDMGVSLGRDTSSGPGGGREGQTLAGPVVPASAHGKS
jgi:DNA-binding MarR family transcriptional regulator